MLSMLQYTRFKNRSLDYKEFERIPEEEVLMTNFKDRPWRKSWQAGRRERDEEGKWTH